MRQSLFSPKADGEHRMTVVKSETKMKTIEQRLTEIEDRFAIQNILAIYGPAIDGASSKFISSVWTKDGVFDRGPTGKQTGSEIWDYADGGEHQSWIKTGVAHIYTAPHVTINGDTAVATAYVSIFLREGEAHKPWRVTANRWDFERTPEGWKINRRTTRLIDGGRPAIDLLHERAAAAAV
jgi:hypothetical protein